MKDRRTAFDKLNTVLFGKDLRITKGAVYSEIREYDFSSYCPEDRYIRSQQLPAENVYDIRNYGASEDKEDNSDSINNAVCDAHKTGGTVLVSGGEYVTKTVFLKSGVTLFIDRDSALASNKTGDGYNHKGIIHADGCENIILTGGGKVKGNAAYS